MVVKASLGASSGEVGGFVGEEVGAAVGGNGAPVGAEVGFLVVGLAVGDDVGRSVGDAVDSVGDSVGPFVGAAVDSPVIVVDDGARVSSEKTDNGASVVAAAGVSCGLPVGETALGAMMGGSVGPAVPPRGAVGAGVEEETPAFSPPSPCSLDEEVEDDR